MLGGLSCFHLRLPARGWTQTFAEEMDPDYVKEQLKYSIQALACIPEIQLKLFPDFTHKPDELIGDFYERYEDIDSLDGFSDDALAALRSLDTAFQSMAPERFTDDAVCNGEDWAHLRKLARNALEILGWELAVPPDNRHIYVGPPD